MIDDCHGCRQGYLSPIRVLKNEASANNGLLSIDTRPHFILYEE